MATGGNTGTITAMEEGEARGGRVAVVVVNYRTPTLALAALRSLAPEREAVPGLRAILVDGGSGDGSGEALSRVVRETDLAGWARVMPLAINGGFGWANNQAILSLLAEAEPPEHILLLNPDAEIVPGAVARLLAVMDRHPRCAAVGSQLLEADGSGSGSAFRFPSVLREFARGLRTPGLTERIGIRPLVAPAEPAEVDWVTGACVLLRTAALREVGLFDSGFFLYFEEVELMTRLRRAGWTIRHEPASTVRHIGGASTGVTSRVTQPRVGPPLPGYWFEARRRFFALTRGRAAVPAANVAWLIGHWCFLARRAAGLARGHVPNLREARDLFAHGLLARARDAEPAPTSADSPPGVAPAWMKGR
jgi:N-acetylglucosaminyl-diphospho-decaprenol L-rhamnosyltransferase